MVERLLQAQGFRLAAEPFSPWCRCASGGSVALGSSLAAFFGLIYIQDRSSMLPPLALASADATGPEWLDARVVLDMCSSPGGKSGFLAQLVGPDGLVLANEPDRERLATLRRNMVRLNLLNVATTQNPGDRLPLEDASVAAILLDPPCSGWGTVEKHPRVERIWREDKVEPLLALQRRLLAEAARILAPGGRLVYSTCTTNVRENEEQIARAVSTLGLTLVPLSPFPGFVFDDPADPALPGVLRVNGAQSAAQGFFIAALAKPGVRPDRGPPGDAAAACPGDGTPVPSVPGAEGVLTPDGRTSADQEHGLVPRGSVCRYGDTAYFLPAAAVDSLPERLRWQGFPLGRVGPDGLRPNARTRRLLPPVERVGRSLNLEDAEILASLLSGRSLQLETPAADSRLPLYFQSLALGWLRVRQRRAVWSER